VKRASTLQGELGTAPIAPRASSSRLLGSRHAMLAPLVSSQARTALHVTPALLALFVENSEVCSALKV